MMCRFLNGLVCSLILLLNFGLAAAAIIEAPPTGGSFQVFGERRASTPNGPGEIHSSSWGQTFRLHAGDGRYLKSISFGLTDFTRDEDAIDFTLHIYAWDGSKIVGDEIFASRILSTKESAQATKFNIPLNYASVELETDYIWVLHPVHDGLDGWGGVEDSYGGTFNEGDFFIFHQNDGDFDLLFTDGWSEVCSSGCRDLAFSLEVLSSLADLDNDAMPDEWEQLHGLNPNADDASNDLDLDGYTNRQECVSATDPNDAGSTPQPPVADAGENYTLYEGGSAALDGSNSSDIDDGIASYLWTQTAGPAVTLRDATEAVTTFLTFPVDTDGTTLTFNLTVRDHAGLQSSQDVTIGIDDNGISGFPPDVLTFTTATGERMGGKIVNGGDWVSLLPVDLISILDTRDKPDNLIYGLLLTELKPDTVGGAVSVTFYLPSPAPENYRWYNFQANRWNDFSANTVFNAARDQATLTLVDGGAGDEDGVADGMIVVASGLGTATQASAGSGSGGGGGGCFIDAAAYVYP